jgi:hypothetical protein
MISSLVMVFVLTPIIVESTSPVIVDANHRLVFRPGHTIPGRSIDAAGKCGTYHFTRYASYRAPDWQPKSE